MVEALKEVDATMAKAWLDNDQAILIDVREDDEYAREHLPEAHLVPLSGFDAADFPHDHEKVAIFHCASGHRTRQAAAKILGTGFREVYQLRGGLSGWKRAGLPTHMNRAAPISLQRQAQMTAGGLVLIGVLLAWLVSPWFVTVSAFVGAGLVFAGASGTCAMASLLGLLPYNRRGASHAA